MEACHRRPVGLSTIASRDVTYMYQFIDVFWINLSWLEMIQPFTYSFRNDRFSALLRVLFVLTDWFGLCLVIYSFRIAQTDFQESKSWIETINPLLNYWTSICREDVVYKKLSSSRYLSFFLVLGKCESDMIVCCGYFGCVAVICERLFKVCYLGVVAGVVRIWSISYGSNGRCVFHFTVFLCWTGQQDQRKRKYGWFIMVSSRIETHGDNEQLLFRAHRFNDSTGLIRFVLWKWVVEFLHCLNIGLQFSSVLIHYHPKRFFNHFVM